MQRDFKKMNFTVFCRVRLHLASTKEDFEDEQFYYQAQCNLQRRIAMFDDEILPNEWIRRRDLGE